MQIGMINGDSLQECTIMIGTALTFSLSVPSSFTSTLFFSWPGPGAVGKLE